MTVQTTEAVARGGMVQVLWKLVGDRVRNQPVVRMAGTATSRRRCDAGVTGVTACAVGHGGIVVIGLGVNRPGTRSMTTGAIQPGSDPGMTGRAIVIRESL